MKKDGAGDLGGREIGHIAFARPGWFMNDAVPVTDYRL
jgi:hypothetical protein